MVGLLLLLMGANAAACVTQADCAYAGDCVASLCRCDAAWFGANCTQLALLPATTDDASGLRRATSSSWGGSVIKDPSSTKYYMLFADMAGHCGLDSWQRNSQISVASAAHATGPFAVDAAAGVICPEFAHNPTVHGPTIDGFFVIYHIGSGHPSSHGPPQKDCTNGTTPPKSTELHAAGSPPPPDAAPTMLSSKSLTGPWSATPLILQPHATLLGGGTASCNNPAASFLANGTVLLVCKVSVTLPGK